MAISRSTILFSKPYHANSQPWFKTAHKKLRQRVNRLYKLHRRDLCNPTLKAAYTLCRNEYRTTIRRARDSYLSALGTSTLSKGRTGGYLWWKRAKRLCNIHGKKHDIQLLKDDVGNHTSSEAKADALCRFFSAQCNQNPNIHHGNRPPPCTTIASEEEDHFRFTAITPAQVYDAARALPVHKSCADTRITNSVLSKCADLLCTPLAILFNYSLEQGVCPKAWKMATIIPIFKKRGCPTQPTNYRLISLLPCIANLFEKLVANQLQTYLSATEKICNEQFAYVKDKSATDQLVILTQYMACYIDKNTNFDLVSLDFCKAFDRVNHSTLLDQIGRFSDPKVTAWIRSYLQDRQIAVQVGSCTSLSKITNCCVPQGSHLSPLLFLIFINDLPTTIMHSHTFLFADDVTLLHPYEHPPSSPALQADIQACQTWARARGGKFSPSKTSVISYSYKSVSPSTAAAYQIDGAPLNGTDVLKHLGIRFTANLNFHQHYIDMSGKFKQRITLLCYMAQRLTPKAMMLLYKSYVRPVIEYGVVVWAYRLPASDLCELDKLQARFIRSYLRRRKFRFAFDTPKQDLNAFAKLESLQYRRQFISLVTLHKFIFKYRNTLAQFSFNISRSERRPNKIILPKALTTSKSLFLFKTSLLWNCLPPTLTSESSVHVFKRESCANILVSIQVYSLACRYPVHRSPPPPPSLPNLYSLVPSSFNAMDPTISGQPLGHPNKVIIIIIIIKN